LVSDTDVLDNGALNHKKLASQVTILGLAFHFSRVSSKRIAIINTREIRRYEHTVAHELGHLLGVKGKNEDEHCVRKKCLMYPLLYPYGRVDKTFCDCCSQQLHDNSLALRKAKASRFVIGNKKIF
jgi:predicted Zn-dependent protease